ncbi:MAG: aldehyde dehydrogenase family protein [Pseudomonadota bacterium]
MKQILDRLGIDTVNWGVCGASGWLTDKESPLLVSRNPASNAEIASVETCSGELYESVIAESVDTFSRWRAVPAAKRGELVRRIADELREYKDALGSLVAMEMGKIKAEGDGEVQEMIDIADFAVGQSRMLYGRTMHSERPEHRLYEQWHPLGPVGVFTAFNFPVAVWAWNAFIAAVAGNTVVWKPSPKTPLCAIAVQQICNRVMTDMNFEGIFSLIVTESNELAERLVHDRRLPLISFTGSTGVGRKVGVMVAERLGRSLLELSGNNAIILDETADLDLAIPAIVFGSVGTAGQRCTTTRRLIIHESIDADVSARLVNAYGQVSVGDPLAEGVLMGPLIDDRAVDGFRQAVNEVQRMGGKILFGGKVIEGPGNFVEPTLAVAENHWEIVQRETFAPILYLMSFGGFDEAIAMHNDASHGLSSALFTNDLRRAERFLASVGSDCGIANINIGTSGAEIGGAFGGEKDTGGGREAGSDAWKSYMRRQTNTINWGKTLPLAQGIRFDLDLS